MKIAFLGKGGSGKSTLATAAVRHLHSTGRHVLAIDADHNMDLSFNLGADGERVAVIPYVFVANKVRDDFSLFESLPHPPIARLFSFQTGESPEDEEDLLDLQIKTQVGPIAYADC